MVIGNGLLAKAFSSNHPMLDDWIIFASGVSDSTETNPLIYIESFKREKELLSKTLKENDGLKFIYFSSVLVGVADSPYYKHKLDMENLIKSERCDYIIFRVPQIVGPNGNKNNLFNYFQDNIINNRINVIYAGIERALVDSDDLVQFVIFAIQRIINETVTLSYIEKITALDLCEKIGKKLEIKPSIWLKDNSSLNNWDVSNSKIVIDWLNGINVSGYTDDIIEKYIKK